MTITAARMVRNSPIPKPTQKNDETENKHDGAGQPEMADHTTDAAGDKGQNDHHEEDPHQAGSVFALARHHDAGHVIQHGLNQKLEDSHGRME